MKIIILLVALFVGIREILVAKQISHQREIYIQKNFTKTLAPPGLLNRFIKRLTDIVVSFAVCITILPILYLVLGILIKLTSKGPIIFRQKRKGLLGREFICYKFRSMYEIENSAYMPTFFDENRVTPIGCFIRKTHLDEFPQFFNVLKGDMSIVGSRPASKSWDNIFYAHQDYAYRLLLRPGITGISQVNSLRLLNPAQIIKLDKYYFLHSSWSLDIKIILRTLRFADKTQ